MRDLVLKAGALGTGGELFVLDMGEQIKIAELARDLIRLSGLEEGVDIDIAYTGVRPGEKLYEEVLFGGEDVLTTNHPKVLRTLGDAAASQALVPQIESLIKHAVSNTCDDALLRSLLHGVVPEFAHQDARTDPRTRPARAQAEPEAVKPRISK